jgi:flagellar motor switch protein FliN
VAESHDDVIGRREEVASETELFAAESEVFAIESDPVEVESKAPVFPEVAVPAIARLPESGVDLSVLADLPLPCYFELGSTRLTISELLGLQRGSVVLLDRAVGEPGRFVVAGKEFAQAEVVALEGGYYGIRITQVTARLSGRETA